MFSSIQVDKNLFNGYVVKFSNNKEVYTTQTHTSPKEKVYRCLWILQFHCKISLFHLLILFQKQNKTKKAQYIYTWSLNNIDLNCAGLELHGSTYKWTFPTEKSPLFVPHTIALHNLRLAESAEVELWIQRAECTVSYMWIFDCAEGWHP